MSEDYKSKKHFFQSYDLYALAGGVVQPINSISVPFQCNVPFPVKEVRFSFAYGISADSLVMYIVSTDMVQSDVIGSLNNYAFTDAGGLAYYIEGFKKDKEMQYIFKEPRQVQNSISINFSNMQQLANISAMNVTVHGEFLG